MSRAESLNDTEVDYDDMEVNDTRESTKKISRREDKDYRTKDKIDKYDRAQDRHRNKDYDREKYRDKESRSSKELDQKDRGKETSDRDETRTRVKKRASIGIRKEKNQRKEENITIKRRERKMSRTELLLTIKRCLEIILIKERLKTTMWPAILLKNLPDLKFFMALTK